jgi:ABC-2 type transport system ATP-binding protein
MTPAAPPLAPTQNVTVSPLTQLPESKAVPPIIEARDATLHFGKTISLDHLTISVPPGTIFGLIGPSGSGKTTTVRVLTGLYTPSEGQVRVLGEEPSKMHSRTRETIGYMPQKFVLYPQLSVWENLNFVASLYGMPILGRGKKLDPLLDFVELTPDKRKLGSQLSGGMQKRLAVAAALVNDPVLIFADEPTAGIDPVLRAKFWDKFRALREQGRTLFVTTQYVGEAAYCDYVGVIREGRLIEMDTPENLRRKAMGGQIIRLVVDLPHERDAMRLLDAHPAVLHVHRAYQEPGQLLIYTDDASATLPVIVNHLNSDSGIELQTIDKYEPPFDDVFVRLMKQDEQNV